MLVFIFVILFLFIIRADDPSNKGPNDQVVDIEGTEYILRTDSNASETTVDTMSVISELEV